MLPQADAMSPTAREETNSQARRLPLARFNARFAVPFVPQLHVESPAVLRLATRPCELQAIARATGVPEGAVRAVRFRRQMRVSLQLTIKRATEEQIKKFPIAVSQGGLFAAPYR